MIGAAQTLLSRRRLNLRRWIPATAVGMGLGLLLGASTVGYRTSLLDLVLMGAVTGVALGTAQALALPDDVPLISVDARDRESSKRALVRITEFALTRLAEASARRSEVSV